MKYVSTAATIIALCAGRALPAPPLALRPAPRTLDRFTLPSLTTGSKTIERKVSGRLRAAGGRPRPGARPCRPAPRPPRAAPPAPPPAAARRQAAGLRGLLAAGHRPDGGARAGRREHRRSRA